MKTIANILKWILSVFTLILALAGIFGKDSLLAGVLFLLLAVIVNPITKQFLEKKGVKIKKAIFIPAVVFGYLCACYALPSPENKDDIEYQVAESAKVEETEPTVATERQIDFEKNMEEENEIPEYTKEVSDEVSHEEDKPEVTDQKTQEDTQEKEVIEVEETVEKEVDQSPENKEGAGKETTEQETSDKEKNEPEQKQIEQNQTEQNQTDKNQTNNDNTGNNEGDGDNFNTYDIPEQQNTAAQWVLNIKSMKIHYPTCNDVKKIKPENYAVSDLSLEVLMGQGYTTCGHCFR